MDKIQTPIMKIVVGAVVIAAVGIGVALATQTWNVAWNPFRASPEQVIGEMLTKMGEIKTGHYETKIEFGTMDEELKKETQISVVFKSDSDSTDPENLKSFTDFDITIATDGIQLSSDGEYKTIGKVSYLKLITIPQLPSLQLIVALLGIDLNEIENQWIRIDEDALKGLQGLEEEEQEETEEQKEMTEELKKLFREGKIYYIKKEFPETYHYLLALDREGIKEIIPELVEIASKYSTSDVITVSPAETKRFNENIDKLFEKTGGIDIEMWIDKKDTLLRKVSIEKEIDMSKLDDTAKGMITIKFDMELSNFDEPITIEAPENFMELEEILPSIPSSTLY